MDHYCVILSRYIGIIVFTFIIIAIIIFCITIIIIIVTL